MSVNQLQQEIKEGVEELGKREEVFVIMIDAVNQVIVRPFIYSLFQVYKKTKAEKSKDIQNFLFCFEFRVSKCLA